MLRAAVSSSRHQLLLCAVTTLLFLVIEVAHPYYFLQDDNRDQNLPYYVANVRAVADHEFPLFNFHQLLGTPLLACVQPAGFYAPNYLAAWASDALFGHYFATIDLVVLFHLILAALGFFRFMRFFKLSVSSSFFGALAWTFCGFVILVGNSWVQIVGFAAYQPWLGLFAFRLLRGFDPRAFAGLTVCRVLQFFLGYPQIFVYSALLEAFGVAGYLLLARVGQVPADTPGSQSDCMPRLARQRALPFAVQYALHYALVTVMTLPVLLPAIHQIGVSVGRSTPIPWEDYSRTMYNLTDWLNGLVRPWADRGADMLYDRNLHVISHVGYLSLGFAVVALAARKSTGATRLVALFALLAAVSFLLASNELLVRAMYAVPGVNRFRWPFKFVFFTSFYIIVLASFGCDLFLRKLAAGPPAGSRWIPAVLAGIFCVQAAGVVWLYAILPQRTFGTHLDRVPLVEPKRDALRSGRVVSVGFQFVDAGGKLYGSTAPSLGYNYATLWGLFHFAGYEIMRSERNAQAALGLSGSSIIPVDEGRPLDLRTDLPLDYLRLWGVRWYLLDGGVRVANTAGLQPVFRDTSRIVLFDPLARPFVYPTAGDPAAVRAYRFSTNAVEVRAESATSGEAVVNVLYNPYFRGYLDGVEMPVGETAESQILVRFPPGSHTIRVVYDDPWFRLGLWLAALGVLLAAAGAAVLMLRAGGVQPRGGSPEDPQGLDGPIPEVSLFKPGSDGDTSGASGAREKDRNVTD
jgi:hypothetical protein